MNLKERRFALHRDLPVNLSYFCTLLRDNDVPVGAAEEIAALQSIASVPFEDPENFRLTLELALSKSPAEIEIFNRLFHSFWFVFDRIGEITKTKEVEKKSTRKKLGYQKKASLLTISDWLGHNTPQAEENREAAAYSAYDSLGETDFSEIPEIRHAEMSKMITKLSKRIASYKSRRYIDRKGGKSIHLKKTLRKNADFGEIIRLYFRSRKYNRTRFTVLMDVSKSMEIYSIFLLNFIYALKSAVKKSECFVFSTKIKPLEMNFARKDFESFRDSLSNDFPEWSGGTRFNECFHSFENEFAPRCTDKKTVLIILSDGWDCGETALLEPTMRKLRSRVKNIIWLNPLAGFEGFKPETECMKICMPFVDAIHPAHNVKSLEKAFLSMMR